jgi:hypothetical protein
MRTIDESKSEHASITLADGTIIGAQQRSIRYQDVSGPIYDMIKSIVSAITLFHYGFIKDYETNLYNIFRLMKENRS